MDLRRSAQLFTSLLVIMVSASINFILIESSLKFWFFVFEIFLVVLMLFFLRNSIEEKIKKASLPFSTEHIDSLLFFFPLILLLLVALKIYSVFVLILAIVNSFFMLGYVILSLLDFKALASPIEKVVLSFYLSIPVNCIFFSFSLLFPKDWRAMIICSAYLVSASSLFFKRKRWQAEQLTQNEHISFSVVEKLTLMIIIAFFIFSVSMTYPQMAYRLGLDIVRHYSESLMINENTASYTSPYPWFHFQLATLQILSKQPMHIFQTSVAFLSVISILSFYIMAKAYLGGLDLKLPVISTIFWSLFSGFGWLYFLTLKMENANPSDYLALLGAANNKSYWDVGYGQGSWIWLWFRPLTLGVTGLFILLYLLKRRDIDKKSLMILAYLAVISIGMTHFSELVFYVMLLLVFSIFLATVVQIRLEETLGSSLIALLTILGLISIYDVMGIKVKIPIMNVIFLATISILSILILKFRHFKLSSFSSALRMKVGNLPVTYVIFGLLILWLATFLCWFFRTENFNVSMVSSVLGVPWLLYPVLLGICGLLTFPAITYIVKHRLHHHPITIFIIIFFVAVIFGRLLTYINVYYVDSGYWERRFIPLMFFASCILASISTLHIVSKIQSKTVLLSLMLSMLVIGGITSTALSIEYQTIIAPKDMLNMDELNQINLLKELSSSSYLLTFSWRSLKISEYAPFAWRINYFRNHIWPATSPELVLNALFCNGNPATIYLTNKDYAQILSSPEYAKGYVMNHLLKSVSPFFDDANASIYFLEAVAPPAENSKVVLVLPENDSDQRYLYAYDIMSLARYNYTTSYISDIQTLSQAETVVAPSETLASEILELKNRLNLSFSKMIILNLDGYYGEYAKISYPSVNVSLESAEFGEAHIRDSISQEIVENLCGTGLLPLIIEVKPSNNSLVLVDDKAAVSWEPSANLSGKIGKPILVDDSYEKASGNDSLRIEVGNGSYAQWQLTWKFENTVNLETYDFITFYWYGRGDGTKYVVQVNTQDSAKYFWYEFIDDWNGWKKVILPMHIADGSHKLYGVSFSKVVKNNATWHNIKSIYFKLSGANLNVAGTFYMDRFAFEKAPIITLKAEVNGPLISFQLLSLTSNGQVSTAQLNSNGSQIINEYWLPDGSSSSEFLGFGVGDVTFREFNSTHYEAILRIKFPVARESNETAQVRFGVNPEFVTIEVSTIKVGSKTLELPAELKVTPLRTSANAIAYFGYNETFFATKLSLPEVDLIYLNYFPLIEAIENGSTAVYENLGTTAMMILGNQSTYMFQTEPINAGNTAAFRQAILQGNITAEFDSVIAKIKGNERLTITVDGQSVNLPENISSICFMEFETRTFDAGYIRIAPGKAFYINATLHNVTLHLEGKQTRLILSLKNGSIYSINGKTVTFKAKNLNALLRKPQISITGKALFTDLYTYQELNRRVRALATDCEIEGHLTFTGVYGDTYTVIKNFEYDGNVKLSKPLYEFDELKSLVEMLPYLFIVAFCYVTLVALRTLRKRD